jgi:hypothetical protein
MPDDISPDQTPPSKPKRSLPWGYLVFALIILAVLGVYIAKPDLPHNLLAGDPAKPESLGEQPAKAGDISGKALSEREMAAERAQLGVIRTSAPLPVASLKPTDTSAPIQAPVAAADETKAAALLTEAEAAYQAMDWDKAESTAHRITSLSAKPSTKGRAADIARGAPILKRLFKDLDDRDELSRNYETNPGLVKLVQGMATTYVVPITQLEAPYNPVTENPVAWIEAQRKAGKVMLLIKGNKQFTPSEMDVQGYEIQPVDQAAVRAEVQQGLSSRVTRVLADRSASRDAFTWYELGKYAYRNRLDDQVVRHLDKAIDLDPMLARSVREANAGILFGSLVAHTKSGNKQQAASFMASIERRYKDTEQAKQARLYFDGKSAELVAAAKAAAQRERDEAEARKRERIERERTKGDEKRAKEIEQQQPEEDVVEDDPAAPPVSSEIAAARQLRDQGAKILGEATNMPATDARNHKYAEAAHILAKAKATYAGYLEKHKNDSAAESELVETQKMWFTAQKMKTL